MLLNSTTSILKLITAQATNVHVIVDYIDYLNGNALNGIQTQKTVITTAATTDILAAPAVNVIRQIKEIHIHNISTTSSNTVTLNIDDNGTPYEPYDCTIGLDEKVYYNNSIGWERLDKAGVFYSKNYEASTPVKTHILHFSKLSVGTSEAAGLHHFMGTAGGLLPAWAIGTSGLGGRAVLQTENGFLKLPSTPNKLVLTENNSICNTAGVPINLVDVLFVNNGIVVTTTTAQTLNTVALPGRDSDRTINGKNCIWGLLVTTATTNAGAITTITGSYTDQDNNAAQTATIPSFPATATVGTFVPFNLAINDISAKSFQSITLGTTLTAGAVSLVCLRIIDTVVPVSGNAPAINGGNLKNTFLYGDEALTVMLMAVGATAYVIGISTIKINEYS